MFATKIIDKMSKPVLQNITMEFVPLRGEHLKVLDSPIGDVSGEILQVIHVLGAGSHTLEIVINYDVPKVHP